LRYADHFYFVAVSNKTRIIICAGFSLQSFAEQKDFRFNLANPADHQRPQPLSGRK
jgi:hypothetical protein